MKRVLVIILSVLILVQSMRGAFVYVSLKLNQAEIAEKYCENKKITMCYGSCYIDKQLKQEESESQKVPLKTVSLKIEVWLISYDIPTINTKPSLVLPLFSTNNFSAYSKKLHSAYLDNIYQPPRNS